MASKKILLIEDDPDQILMYETAFTKAGFLVEAVRHKGEVLAAIKHERPDLVFVDMLLGEDSGLDVIKELKNNIDTRDIVIVALSNFNKKDLVKEAKKLGAKDFLVKSQVMPKEIAGLVEGYLS